MRYDSLPETAPVNVANRYVTFSRKFKYLGSRISYSLRDDDDINARLAAASQSMGALKEVWRNPHLDTYSKYLLFRAIPVNLLLWGCENWSLRQSLLRQLEVFLHRNIRRILNLSMNDVKEEHIRNKKVRQMFYNIPCIQNMIAARQLSFVGKVVRGPHDAPARRMLTACCQHKRKVGRPYLHNKDIIVRHLRLLFAKVPEVLIDDYGSVSDWYREASHEQYWGQLIECLLAPLLPIPTRPTNWPPLRRRSLRTNTSEHHNHMPGESNRRTNSADSPPIQSPLRRRPPKPPPPQRPSSPPPQYHQHRGDFDPLLVGYSLEHSFKVLGLGLGATETEVKVRYRALARIYHPDRHNSAQTGLTHLEASQYFQLINNANSYLFEIL